MIKAVFINICDCCHVEKPDIFAPRMIKEFDLETIGTSIRYGIPTGWGWVRGLLYCDVCMEKAWSILNPLTSRAG